ncbi:dUTP diphosphatase [Rufibacter sediminis]|uniref:Deoxyuridine 5'-triphosphate nucleotidohydrolase n=1 Tax=Rufibacter sediminis TaxID=2762756 RepID=A0ABR6VTX9_9BACT|nr:dUTP diphosphatase [Rufibacter sediminis]MBC3540643.1 dUTP diphosphatase [Rufibacter sediminis]
MTRTPILLTALPHYDGLPLPTYATPGSAGLDLLAAIPERVIIYPGERLLVPCGIAIGLPDGMEAQIRPRSGLANKHGVTVLNSPGTVDADYRGEIHALLINHGSTHFVISRGDRIAQMVIAQVAQVEWDHVEALPETVRGAGGFGSTGR